MIGIQALMRNVSIELDRLAQVAERLDEKIGGLVADTHDSAKVVSTDLQDMDVLRQALFALSQITQSAAREIPDDLGALLQKDALGAGVTLEQTREACLETGAAARFQPISAQTNVAGHFFEEF